MIRELFDAGWEYTEGGTSFGMLLTPTQPVTLPHDASIGSAQLKVADTSPPTVTCPAPNSIGSDGRICACAVAAAQARNSHASPAAALLQTFMAMQKL